MKAMNQLTVMGRLTKDPESPFNENAPAKFRLAIDRRGSEVTDYVDVAAFNGLGEIVVEHLKKGRRVIVIGSLRYSEWAVAQGAKHSKHEVLAENVFFVDPPRKEDQAGVA
jgi:single-strand DNA-binding protein